MLIDNSMLNDKAWIKPRLELASETARSERRLHIDSYTSQITGKKSFPGSQSDFIFKLAITGNNQRTEWDINQVKIHVQCRHNLVISLDTRSR